MLCTTHFVSVVLFASISLIYFVTPVSSVMAADGVHLVNFNQTFYLANETYVFQLFPIYNVPRSVIRHIIYTGTLNTTVSFSKRALMEYSHEKLEFAEDDHALLNEFLGGDVPSFVKVNTRKRSLPMVDGVRIIKLTPKATLITAGFKESKKRGLSQLGTQVCLHVPFFTTCDNSADLTTVKTALTAAVDEIHTELDSYEATNNARINALSSALNTQRGIIDSMLTNLQQTGTLVAQVASSVQVNAAQIADGDFQAMSQINYLKRVTNSLLKYSNALASTDPRAVVAQPSMSKLFSGFISVMQTLKSTGLIPIVDTDTSTAFTWQETILPAQSVQNSSAAPCLNSSNCQYEPGFMSVGNNYIPSFSAILALSCVVTGGNYPAVPACVSPAVVNIEPTRNWIYGPFHKSHYGIYTVTVPLSSSSSVSAYVMQPVNQAVRYGGLTTAVIPVAPQTTSYCVQFLGYTMFASQAAALGLVNGYSSVSPDSDCDVLRIVDGSGLTTTTYSLYAELEGIVVPFYSSCDLVPLQNDLYIYSPTEAAVISTMNYVCSNGWTQFAQGANASSACSIIPKSLPDTDIYLYHWVSPNCYINIEPGWMDLSYYVDPPLLTIPNIPRGFQLNQFTINPAGELSSSLEFVYTDQWLTVYSIERVSDNRLITDEITVLDGSVVLFYLDTEGVIDESDSFFGMGNNGRDCIQQAPSYDYNLLNCFFQNDNTLYTPSQYVTGIVVTTGIARYNDKFDFTLNAGVPNETISFSLVPNAYSDFSYSVQMDGNLCPQFLNQETYTSGCIVSLFYSGREQIELQPTSSSNQIITATFPTPSAKNFTIALDTWTISAGGKECFILQCQYSVNFNVVKLSTPNVQLISAADLALQTTMELSIGTTLKSTIDSMNNVIEQVSQANKNLSALRQTLDSLNFNVSQLYPYQNFTTMRNQLNQLINSIGTPSSDTSSPSSNCDGPWNSVQCWFQSFASVLIYVAICIVVVLGGYIVCIRMGVAKKLFGKINKKPSSESDTGQVGYAEIRLSTRNETF